VNAPPSVIAAPSQDDGVCLVGWFFPKNAVSENYVQ
jgi:hypothetical protein